MKISLTMISLLVVAGNLWASNAIDFRVLNNDLMAQKKRALIYGGFDSTTCIVTEDKVYKMQEIAGIPVYEIRDIRIPSLPSMADKVVKEMDDRFSKGGMTWRPNIVYETIGFRTNGGGARYQLWEDVVSTAQSVIQVLDHFCK